ncbi:DEAD/DEAH box helicase [Sandaracinus amylolyticus]|uniref:Putative helicase n=1 Tax=Sandaracinus amylolyticus TaxID=927083 RepID=A0A0F6SGK3_9BACT|nr:DEAD/DEAH box helicase [Sandaracinus amylolyticus]AKF08844.1 Putative helicase [Sandaracinus amylolyticus]
MSAARDLAREPRAFGTARLVIGDDGRRWWSIEAAPSVMLRLRRLFQGSARSGKRIVVADTLEACRDIEWVCERWRLSIEPADYAAERAGRHREAEEAVERILAAGYLPRTFDLAIQPREYQRRAAELALRTRQLLLADDVGLGKTASAICALTDPTARPALVVTLTHLPKQWEAELARFAPGMRVHRIRDGAIYDIAAWGPRRRKRRAGQLEIAGTEPKLPDVIVTSYSKLAKWADVLAPIAKSVVFDEVQELRKHGSNKYEAATQIAQAVDLRVGLSATPIYNYGAEMFNVLEVLAPGALGSWPEFAATWCGSEGADREKAELKDPRAFGAWAREQGFMLRRTRADVGRELPAVTRAAQHVDCDAKPLEEIQGRAAELAKIILAQDQKGFDKMKAGGELDWQLRRATGIAKAPFVADFLRLLVESGERVLCFAWHHAVYDVIEERLKDLGVARYTGEESATQKDAARAAFVDGKARVLLMSLRSGAGLDGLQSVCRTVVFAELDWSPGVHEQCIGRVHRDGQTDPVVAYYLTTDQGSDPIVMDVLGVKRVQVEGLRNPDAEIAAAQQIDPDHIRKLAESFLAKRSDDDA